MRLTDEQQEVIDILRGGGNVAVKAIPGGGKTALLTEACRGAKRCLLLAYNTQLAAQISESIADLDVVCCTFHSLCSRCIMPARDDVGILRAIDAVERGEVVPHDVPDVQRVLIDESQDVRELYVRLLRLLRVCAPHLPTLVVGDERQLIYTFDPDFPATTDTLLRPSKVFGGSWLDRSLTQSHRLTRPMTELVNRLFGTDIVSGREGCAVEIVRAQRWNMYGTLKRVIAECDPSTTMLLVDRKRGNAPLRTLLNCMSRDGHRVHVHGVDSDDPATMRGKLCVSTWWAAKGMECDTAIVIVPRFTPRNPFYVALTRARRKLVVVFDPQEPHSRLCEVAIGTPSEEDSFDETLRDTWILPPTSAGSLRRVDGWRAPRSLIDAYVVDHVVFVGDDLSDLSSTFTTIDGRTEDCAHAIFRMALLYAEWRMKGRLRAMSDVSLPVRIDRSRQAEAITLGLSARSVSMMRLSDDMLSADMRDSAQDAIRSLTRADTPTATCLADISLAVIAWDNFDHASRQLMPTSLWRDKEIVGKAMHNATLLFKDATDFDVLLRTERGGGLAYLRTHAVSDGNSYHAVWGEESVCLSHDTLSQAIMHASLHESGSCTVVDLCHGWSRRVSVAHPHVILDSALRSE